MNQKEELKDNQFKYDVDGIVTVHDFERMKYEYKGINEEDVRTLNSKLHGKLIEEIRKFEIQREALLKEREKKKEEEGIAKNTKLQDEFKKQLLSEVPKLMELRHTFKGIDSYREPRAVSFYVEESRIATLFHDDRAWGRGSYHSHETKLVFVVEDKNYKKRRYKTLKGVETAVLKRAKWTLEEIKEEKDEYSAYNSFASAAGLRYVKTSEFSSYHPRIRREIHLAVPEGQEYHNADIVFRLSTYKNTVIATKVTINKEIKILGSVSSKTELQLVLNTPDKVKTFVETIEKASVK